MQYITIVSPFMLKVGDYPIVVPQNNQYFKRTDAITDTGHYRYGLSGFIQGERIVYLIHVNKDGIEYVETVDDRGLTISIDRYTPPEPIKGEEFWKSSQVNRFYLFGMDGEPVIEMFGNRMEEIKAAKKEIDKV